MISELILKVDGKEVCIEKGHKFWEFDTQEGEPAEMYSIKFYTLEAAIKEYLEDLEERKNDNA